VPTPLPPTAPLARSESDDVLSVVRRYGSLAGHYSVFGPDPWRVLFSSSREGVIFFLESSHCILVWRGPICAPGQHRELLSTVTQYARTRRCGVFVLHADVATQAAASSLGLRSLWIGHETFVEVPPFNLSGARREKLRLAINFARRHGVTWREIHPGTSPADHNSMFSLEEAWKEERKERRTNSFLRNDFTELGEHRRYFVAEDHDVAVASATLTRVNDDSWYLQDIVRRPDAPRGALEGAIAESIFAIQRDGAARLSNGPLPLWSPEDGDIPTPQLGPLGRTILRTFDRSFRFRGINTFRTKLAPDEIVPLYVIYSRRGLSPQSIRSLLQLLQKPPGPATADESQ